MCDYSLYFKSTSKMKEIRLEHLQLVLKLNTWQAWEKLFGSWWFPLIFMIFFKCKLSWERIMSATVTVVRLLFTHTVSIIIMCLLCTVYQHVFSWISEKNSNQICFFFLFVPKSTHLSNLGLSSRCFDNTLAKTCSLCVGKHVYFVHIDFVGWTSAYFEIPTLVFTASKSYCMYPSGWHVLILVF